MTKLEKQQAIEILRLRSLCRYAASELRALDNIILQRHPCSSGLSDSFMDTLEEKKPGGYIEKYADLQREMKSIADDLVRRKDQDDLSTEFEDLSV